jgi:TFIIF-interacting CTD phosphatase-like protein
MQHSSFDYCTQCISFAHKLLFRSKQAITTTTSETFTETMFYPWSTSTNSTFISEVSSCDGTRIDSKLHLSVGSRGESFNVVQGAPKAYKPKSDLIVLMDIDLTMVKTSILPTYEKAQAFIEHLPCDMLHHCQMIGDSFAVVQLRPGLPNFLKNLAFTCEVHIFTAGTQGYANSVASLLDPDNTVFPRDQIWSRTNGPYVRFEPDLHWKNISQLPLRRRGDLRRVVLIDDNRDTMIANPGNVYLIPQFLGTNNDDQELEKAWRFMTQNLMDVGDVRPVLQHTFLWPMASYVWQYPRRCLHIRDDGSLLQNHLIIVPSETSTKECPGNDTIRTIPLLAITNEAFNKMQC